MQSDVVDSFREWFDASYEHDTFWSINDLLNFILYVSLLLYVCSLVLFDNSNLLLELDVYR